MARKEGMNMRKYKKALIKALACMEAIVLFFGFFLTEKSGAGYVSAADALITKLNTAIDTKIENYFDDENVYRLSDTITKDTEISVIVSMDTDTMLDSYDNADTDESLAEYRQTSAAKKTSIDIQNKRDALYRALNQSDVDYTLGETYDTLLSGFEITIKASDFSKVSDLIGGNATLIVGEEYQAAEASNGTTTVVTNEVDIYETGIFNGSASGYTGEGVIVAVLDTGLDYTHTAFAESNFYAKELAFTLSDVAEVIDQTTAYSFTSGLTAEDVYVSRKVPFAYDYADKDPDVLPTNSSHGTHVSGVIAGNDDTITGVAPNAQIAAMKVFSDSMDSAKSAWILAALEDCVTLGVDVINMSLGTSCGFSRDVDNSEVNRIYDGIRERGISLIVAAGNSYNATFGSSKNGSLGLTSNPDSGTVSSPSTYAAALSVASVDGVKTPYMLYGDQIIYFNEATNSSAETKHFVDEVLDEVGGVDSYDFEYVTIPGVGRAADYPQDKSYYKGKIVLVKRGTTTFEEKVRVALKVKGAAGVIIYNNVSGTISMSVGDDYGAACSVSQDEGELLASAGTGIIRISKSQVAGPFMSDFSSWGPTSDLKIKPEITAHGGEILSAIPGQNYERMSGTSMAAPNQAGATALIRQYVKDSSFGNLLSARGVTAVVNQLMMSTADIVMNKNGLPYSVRKQGAGLVNITKATTTASYITTYDENGDAMDKTKLELGDDKNRTGNYTMTFTINNIGGTAVTYEVDSIIQTEGVSTTYTSHGDTTVTEDGYLLSGTKTTVLGVQNGRQNGNSVTVDANSSATVTLNVTLSETDKAYIEKSFAYGMYVEGFITLEAKAGTSVDMNVPLLAFYGDWTEAPVFDEEYYDTNADELNAGIDEEDKLMADAYATEVIGTFYSDYIAVLGSYYFEQNPSMTPIAADKDHIAISCYENSSSSAVNTVQSIWAGLLRNVKHVEISVTDTSTGKVIFTKESDNQRKSYSSGSTVYQSQIDMDFSALEYNLKNNTQYNVTVTTYIDYDENADQNNVRNTFEFPLYVDFQAPAVTNVTYRSEYDKDEKITHLYADLEVYDNHYAMALQIGNIVYDEAASQFSLNTFDKYITPVYSSFNSTSKVTVELTDYLNEIQNSDGINYNTDKADGYEIVPKKAFIVVCYDYAMNMATYELELPDDILSICFTEENVTLNPNETLDLTSILEVYPGESWVQTLSFESADPEIVGVVNQTLIGYKSGMTTITAIGYNTSGERFSATLSVKVLQEGDDGYDGTYTADINAFSLDGYYVEKAFYSVTTAEREIGVTGAVYDFGSSRYLSMYPAESVTLRYTLASYFPDATEVVFSVSDETIASVDENGTIVALAEGSTSIGIGIIVNGKTSLSSASVTINVKDPFTTSSIYLMSYKGLGGEVYIPDDRGITTIYSFAFSNYEYVSKDLENGDVIDDEDPYTVKQWYLGDDTITYVKIPEGVTAINSYAFAGLTALKKVDLPSTLTMIGVGAFMGCTALEEINLDNVQFINGYAFSECTSLSSVTMKKIVAINEYGFAYCAITDLHLPSTAQSLGLGAFYENKRLDSVNFDAAKMKIGSYVFAECSQLISVDLNASVVSSYAFYNCKELTDVYLGKDVTVISEFAFSGTRVASFELNSRNASLSLSADKAIIYRNNGQELVLAAPLYSGNESNAVVTDATAIATGAFAENGLIVKVIAENAVTIGEYAFANCGSLSEVVIPSAKTVCDYAFYGTALKTIELGNVSEIGAGAFANTYLESAAISDNATLGNYSFAYNPYLTTVTLGNNVTVGDYAFYIPTYFYTYEALYEEYGYTLLYYLYNGEFDLRSYYTEYTYTATSGDETIDYTYYTYDYEKACAAEGNPVSQLTSVTVGAGTSLGENAFSGNVKLRELTLSGGNIRIGAYAFYNARALETVDFSKVVSVGAYAFSGTQTLDFNIYNVYSWGYAYEYVNVDGEWITSSYRFSSYAPAIRTADLSCLSDADAENGVALGEGAFAYNTALQSVTFGEELTKISDGVFANCIALTSISGLEGVSLVGQSAFYSTGLTTLDLSSASEVGAYAFALTPVTSVLLKDGVTIDEGAFAYCYSLTVAENLDLATSIGGYAFYGTALKELTLSAAESIGDYAFGASAAESVTFGTQLRELGENPFYGCAIASYGKESDVVFNGTSVGSVLEENYAISDTVLVIDGVLYQKVPLGLELISYPLLKDSTSYIVAADTVRIGARAFFGASLFSVELPASLNAIGDKAFYACENLAAVIFNGYDAPILEEEYDTSYAIYENIPMAGEIRDEANELCNGLGIVPFYMWNITSSYNNFYFGSNFVNYIGKISSPLVMVRPANGQNYDSFIFTRYFSTIVDGNNALQEYTLAVIAEIAALPSSITLSDEAAVVAARAAYDKITSLEQQALVGNLDKLEAAESMINVLKNRNESNGGQSDNVIDNEEKGGCGSMLSTFGGIFAVVLLTGVCILLKKKKTSEPVGREDKEA